MMKRAAFWRQSRGRGGPALLLLQEHKLGMAAPLTQPCRSPICRAAIKMLCKKTREMGLFSEMPCAMRSLLQLHKSSIKVGNSPCN